MRKKTQKENWGKKLINKKRKVDFIKHWAKLMGHTFVGFFLLVLFFPFPPNIFYFIFSHFFLLCVYFLRCFVFTTSRGSRVNEEPAVSRERGSGFTINKCFKRKISCTVPTDSPAAWPLILALYSHIGLLRCVKIPGLPFDSFLFQKENIHSRKENPFSFIPFFLDLFS